MEKQEILFDLYYNKINNVNKDFYISVCKRKQLIYTQRNCFEEAFFWREIKSFIEQKIK